MERILHDIYGCQIIGRDDKFFIRFDAGHLAVKMEELEITKAEVSQAIISPEEAYKVILQATKRKENIN
jgi:hypothetical protein